MFFNNVVIHWKSYLLIEKKYCFPLMSHSPRNEFLKKFNKLNFYLHDKIFKHFWASDVLSETGQAKKIVLNRGEYIKVNI